MDGVVNTFYEVVVVALHQYRPFLNTLGDLYLNYGIVPIGIIGILNFHSGSTWTRLSLTTGLASERDMKIWKILKY